MDNKNHEAEKCPTNRVQEGAVARAERWTHDQAARLGVSYACILDAIKAGHLPSNIEKMVNRHPLGFAPTGSSGIEFTIVGQQPIRRKNPLVFEH